MTHADESVLWRVVSHGGSLRAEGAATRIHPWRDVPGTSNVTASGAIGSSRMSSRIVRIEPACVFLGPSLRRAAVPPHIEVLPPATRGAVTAAVKSGYTRIGVIDGAVEESERLPLRELREALATPGVTVLGGASMGAVRAVQLESAGMQGVGRVFRLFRRGVLTDADEVYVLHAPATLHYRSLTLPLVNIRHTLRAMRLARRLSAAEERAIVSYMRDVPWFDRDRHALSAAIHATCGSRRCALITHAFDAMCRDAKQEDALRVLSHLNCRAHSERRRFEVIEQPFGGLEDGRDVMTVRGLSKRKDE